MKKIILILILIPQVLFSQENPRSNTIPDDLIGTWQQETEGEGSTPSQIEKYIFKLNDMGEAVSEFHRQVKWPEFKDYITVGILEGYIQFEDDDIKIQLYRVGQQQADSIQWFYPGSDLFERAPQGEMYTYKVKRNKLTLMSDENDDGDFFDDEETRVFEKIP